MKWHWLRHLQPSQMKDLQDLYQMEWWSKGRTLRQIRKMLQLSDLLFAAVDADERLIAFARVVTDFTYRATLLDVIVHPDHRGKGLGRALLEKVLSHPRLRPVERLDLFCLPPLIPFYKKMGFQADRLGIVRLSIDPKQGPSALNRNFKNIKRRKKRDAHRA